MIVKCQKLYQSLISAVCNKRSIKFSFLTKENRSQINPIKCDELRVAFSGCAQKRTDNSTMVDAEHDDGMNMRATSHKSFKNTLSFKTTQAYRCRFRRFKISKVFLYACACVTKV